MSSSLNPAIQPISNTSTNFSSVTALSPTFQGCDVGYKLTLDQNSKSIYNCSCAPGYVSAPNNKCVLAPKPPSSTPSK